MQEELAASFANSEQHSITLDTQIDDPETLAAIISRPGPRERDRFIRTALRIGVIALGQAQGRIDTEQVRDEGDRLIQILQHQLADHQRSTTEKLTDTLRDYFDPNSGRFPERVKQLVGQGGELETLLRTRFENSQQSFESFLQSWIGPESPFQKLLSPGEQNIFLAALKATIESSAGKQAEVILGEFSLDNPDGALSRMIRELADKHGKAATELQGQIKDVMKEFSLDSESSALSRLVKRVDEAQAKIQSEFTLDSEQSALARMKKELTTLIQNQNNDTQIFQRQVYEALADLRARKEEQAKTTAHGHDFENQATEYIQNFLRGSGDIVEQVGKKTGIKPNSKKGDVVIQLSPDNAAAGARIVLEMKEDSSYSLKDSLDEIAEARENRQATIGIFIHSKKTVPTNFTEPLSRFENDIVVVWDAESESHDAYLKAAILMAKGLAVRARKLSDNLKADVDIIDKALSSINKSVEGMDEIKTSAQTIKNSADKILERARIAQATLEKNMAILSEQVGNLKYLAEG